MLDAMRLASPVGENDILWRPSSLQDIYDIPARVLLLFDYYRLGAANRQQPWAWYGIKDKRSTSHQYNADYRGKPQPPARCGFKPPEGATLATSEVGKCAKCSKLDKGESTEATGTVAGVRVGASSRPGASGDQGHREGQA